MSKVEEKRAEQKRRMDSKCRHYTGCFDDKKCAAGICYREMVGGPDLGWVARLPCIPESPLNKEPMAKCDFYEVLSPEEIAKRDAAVTRMHEQDTWAAVCMEERDAAQAELVAMRNQRDVTKEANEGWARQCEGLKGLLMEAAATLDEAELAMNHALELEYCGEGSTRGMVSAALKETRKTLARLRSGKDGGKKDG